MGANEKYHQYDNGNLPEFKHNNIKTLILRKVLLTYLAAMHTTWHV